MTRHRPGPATATPPRLRPPRERAEAEGAGVLVSVTIFVAVVAFAILPLTVELGRVRPELAVVAVCHALVCALGAALAVHRGFRPCLLVASVFPYCWLVVASIYQIATTQAAWGDAGVTLDVSRTLQAQLVLMVGQLCLLLGYLGGMAVPVAARRFSPTADRRTRVGWLAAVYLLLAAALVPFVVATAGGFGTLFTSRNVVADALGNGGLQETQTVVGGLVKIAPASLATAAALLGHWVARESRRGTGVRRAGWAVLAGAILVLVLVANPFAYTRFISLAAFGTVALAVLAPRRRAAGVAWLVLAVVVFLVAYPAGNYFRYGTFATGGDPTLASPDFDGFQQAVNTVGFVQRHGIGWGIHLLSGVLFFVPRSLWPGKADPSTFEVAQDRGYVFQNLSMPLPSEFYLDLGWLGVVVGLALVGFVWARLDRAWAERSALAVVASYVAVAQVGLWRGPFGGSAPVLGLAVVGLLLAVVVARRRRGGREPEPVEDSVDADPGDGLGELGDGLGERGPRRRAVRA